MVQLITFTVNSVEHQAEEGVIWEEWVDSDYNTDNFISYGNNIISSSGINKINGVSIAYTIIADKNTI